MIRADAITLIAESPEAHGVFDNYAESKRVVPAEIRSVSRSEFFRAKENGLNPEYVFVLADYAEYEGEKIAEWNGERWAVIRTYVDREKIELTVEPATIDSVAQTTEGVIDIVG